MSGTAFFHLRNVLEGYVFEEIYVNSHYAW